MFSKNFIFTALFFGIVLVCISCLGNEKESQYKKNYTIQPTDSSNFTISLDGIETIKTPNLNLDGKWKMMGDASTQKNKTLFLIFEGRKIYSSLNSDSYYIEQKTPIDSYQTFAFYDICPDENGIYNKKGDFLVIGSGNEKQVCYKVMSFSDTKLVLYDVEKGGELEFKKIGIRD